MKRIIFTLLVMLSAISINAQQFYGRVISSDGFANIRKGPGTKYAIVKTYKSEDYLYYTPEKSGWSKVYTSKDKSSYMGYIYTKLIAKVEDVMPDNMETGIITDPVDNYVNVRRGPSTKDAISSRLDLGTEVYFIKYNANWAKVFNMDREFLGYVSLSRISK